MISFADSVPLAGLETDPSRVFNPAAAAHPPGLVTNGGRGVAVIQSPKDYEMAEEEAFMRAVVAGLAALESGWQVAFTGAKVRHGLKKLPGESE